MASSRLHELSARGVSVWMDSLSRELLETGELGRLIDEDAVVGVTSNPTIFEKALSTGDWYDDELRDAMTRHDDSKEIFLELAVEDVSRACDLLRPTWERSAGVDGYVSIEVDPDLAYDREATFDEAMRLHELVDRDNVYVKIPGTEPGLGAIEDSIARGRSINVTLIFSLARHAEVAEAYVRGLERLVEGGGDPWPCRERRARRRELPVRPDEPDRHRDPACRRPLEHDPRLGLAHPAHVDAADRRPARQRLSLHEQDGAEDGSQHTHEHDDPEHEQQCAASAPS